MSESLRTSTGYSSNVTARLLVAGKVYEVWKAGPDSIFLRTPVDLPPCDGEVVITVDGCEARHRVHLPGGASVAERRVVTVDLSRLPAVQ
jgi:hypothetical protein